MNPFDMLKMGKNPQELILSNFSKEDNSFISNLIKMAKNGNSNEIEQFARNFCKERGKNFDDEFPKFMNQFKN